MLKKNLEPTLTIDCENKSIKKKAEDLTKKFEKDSRKAKSLFYFVRDEIKYHSGQNYLLEYHIASKTLKRQSGYCVAKAILLAALARAVEIPARLRFADIRNHRLPEKYKKLIKGNLLVYHGYDELYIGEKWVKADPAYDLELCEKHRIVPVDFDGKHDAKFHRYNQDGELHIEYVKDHGHYHYLPFGEMMDARKQIYGPDFVERRALFNNSSRKYL